MNFDGCFLSLWLLFEQCEVVYDEERSSNNVVLRQRKSSLTILSGFEWNYEHIYFKYELGTIHI